jgi:hypothetical protein
MFDTLTKIAYTYNEPLHEVNTTWESYADKHMKTIDTLVKDVRWSNAFDYCRQEALPKVDRYYRFKKYVENK